MSHPLPDAPEQRVLHPIPTRELERRWRAVREHMEERGIDALVMQNSNDWLGGYVKWFTDRPATNAYPRAIVFPRDGRMVSVEQGPAGGVREVPPADEIDRGVERIVFTPSYASIHYTGTYDAELVQAELRRRGYKTVGLVGTACMYHDFCAHLKQTAGSVRFVDATDMIDHIKAIKSADEIEAILDDDSVDVIVGSAVLDVLVLVEDEALLALPQAPRHAVCPEQQGIQQAAPVRNQAEQQATQEKASPFAALKDLKRDLKRN